MHSTEITLDKDEFPIGCSGRTFYEDEDCCVVFGQGNTYNDNRPMVRFELKKVNLRIYGGKTFRDFLKLHESDMYNAAWQYLLRSNEPVKDIILQMISNAHISGIEEGRKQKAQEFRSFLEND